ADADTQIAAADGITRRTKKVPQQRRPGRCSHTYDMLRTTTRQRPSITVDSLVGLPRIHLDRNVTRSPGRATVLLKKHPLRRVRQPRRNLYLGLRTRTANYK